MTGFAPLKSVLPKKIIKQFNLLSDGADIAQLPAGRACGIFIEYGATEPGLNRLIREAYSLLGLATYFTAGEKEVRAWTIKTGMKAHKRQELFTLILKKASSEPKPTTVKIYLL